MNDSEKQFNGNAALQALSAEFAEPKTASPGNKPDTLPGAIENLNSVSNASEIADLLTMFRDGVCLLLAVESPKKNLDGATIKQLGDVWGKVADKHNFRVMDSFGNYGPEIMAVAITAGVAKGLYAGLKIELQAKKIVAEVPSEPAKPDAKDTPIADKILVPDNVDGTGFNARFQATPNPFAMPDPVPVVPEKPVKVGLIPKAQKK